MGAKVVNLVSAEEVAAGCGKQYEATQKAQKAQIEKRLAAVKKKADELRELTKTIATLKKKHGEVLSRQGSQLATLEAQLKKKKKKK